MIPILGCHLPISSNVFDNAKKIGADVIQIVRGPQTLEKIRTNRLMNKDIGLFVHTKYGINLTDKMANWIPNVIGQDLKLCDELGGVGTVIHAGTGIFRPDIVAKNLMSLGEQCLQYRSKIIIEGQATCGSLIVNDVNDMWLLWQELLKINAKFAAQKFAFCLDTCHLCVGKRPIKGTQLFEEFLKFDKLIGAQHLALIHFNDAKTLTADRHENIFEGYIGSRKLGGNPMSLITVCAWAIDYKVPLIIERDKESLQSLARQIKGIKKLMVEGPHNMEYNLMQMLNSIS